MIIESRLELSIHLNQHIVFNQQLVFNSDFSTNSGSKCKFVFDEILPQIKKIIINRVKCAIDLWTTIMVYLHSVILRKSANPGCIHQNSPLRDLHDMASIHLVVLFRQYTSLWNNV